ncbi:MAG: hypothetical protein ABIH46_01410, partial [Chloroflexota bacterium]
NFPREKQALLPDNYVLKDLGDALVTEKAMVLVDEGTTQLPAGGRMEEFIKACSSLSRQRDQIVIFVFHASRDIGSRILRGVDVVMIKEPSRRQIQQGSKDKWFRELLVNAKREIRGKSGERRCWTYVDAEDPDFTSLMHNSLPTYWSEELSKAWGGVSLFGEEPTGIEQQIEALGITSRKGPRCFSCDRPPIAMCRCHGIGFCAEHLKEEEDKYLRSEVDG